MSNRISDEEAQMPRASYFAPALNTFATTLNEVNYCNFVGFIANITTTYGSQLLRGATKTIDLSLKYQTLITPKSYALTIWGLIFASQGLFVIVQMFPMFQAKPVVQSLQFYFFFSCIFQSIWNILYAYEMIVLSLLMIFFVFVLGLIIIVKQYYAELEYTMTEFWVFRFPFMLSFGWISCTLLINMNKAMVISDFLDDTQLTASIISLVLLHALSLISLLYPEKPNFIIPVVIIWTCSWIGSELSNPQDMILGKFGLTVVNGMKNSAYSIAAIISIQIISRLGLSIHSEES